jgi:uncharacterized protein (TIGR01777 family)
MRILVTGATGFVGRPLVRRLLAAGHEVEALSRDSEHAAAVLPARCRVDGWHPREGVSLEHLEPLDAVIHLAGEGIADARWSEERKQALYRSRIDTTRALVKAMTELPAERRPKAFVCSSATGYYGDRGDELLDEDSAPGQGFLSDICRDWEKEAFVAGAEGIRTVAVRTGVVLGRDGGALDKMLPPFRLGVGGRLGSGRQWMSWIHLEDLVELFRFAVDNPQARGPINGVAPNPLTNSQFTAALSRVLGRPAFFPVPAAVLKLAFGEMSTVLLGSQRVKPAAAERLGFKFKFAEVGAALEEICSDLSNQLEREQWVPHDPDEVFRFFSDARNLERITPPFLNFNVRNISTPQLGEGSLIDYSIRLNGLPVRWRSRIEDWKPNESFVDTQTRGPYALWHHTHEFEPHNGGTIVRDRVRYRVPFGALGNLVGGAWVRSNLRRIFDYRRLQMMSLFPAERAEKAWDEV